MIVAICSEVLFFFGAITVVTCLFLIGAMPAFRHRIPVYLSKPLYKNILYFMSVILFLMLIVFFAVVNREAFKYFSAITRACLALTIICLIFMLAAMSISIIRRYKITLKGLACFCKCILVIISFSAIILVLSRRHVLLFGCIVSLLTSLTSFFLIWAYLRYKQERVKLDSKKTFTAVIAGLLISSFLWIALLIVVGYIQISHLHGLLMDSTRLKVDYWNINFTNWKMVSAHSIVNDKDIIKSAAKLLKTSMYQYNLHIGMFAMPLRDTERIVVNLYNRETMIGGFGVNGSWVSVASGHSFDCVEDVHLALKFREILKIPSAEGARQY